jgi:hypothetical protein
MKYWKIKILNHASDADEEVYFLEALNYSEDEIKEIFKEVHPEWEIINISPTEKPPTKK